MFTAEDRTHLNLCEDFCDCGTPDPLYEGHAKSCLMSLPLEILMEVETIAPTAKQAVIRLP